SLDQRDGRAAQRTADHNADAGNGGHQRLFQKSELAIPQQGDPRKDGGEQDGHADDAGGDELKIAAVSRLLKDGAESEAEGQKIEKRLAERGGDLRAGAQVALEFAEPQDIDRAHRWRLHILANWRS